LDNNSINLTTCKNILNLIAEKGLYVKHKNVNGFVPDQAYAEMARTQMQPPILSAIAMAVILFLIIAKGLIVMSQSLL